MEEKLCSDCMVIKQWFRAFAKINRSTVGTRSTDKADESGSLAMGRDVTLFLEIFKHIFSFLFF